MTGDAGRCGRSKGRCPGLNLSRHQRGDDARRPAQRPPLGTSRPGPRRPGMARCRAHGASARRPEASARAGSDRGERGDARRTCVHADQHRPGRSRRRREMAGQQLVELLGAQRRREVERPARPWQPSILSSATWSSVSTPSATADMPIALARSMMARTIAESTGFSAMPCTKRAVHLDLVHGELLEVGERGVAGAEVVDGQPHAKPVELLHDLASPGEVSHDHGLGDLEGEQLRAAGRWHRAPPPPATRARSPGTGAVRG